MDYGGIDISARDDENDGNKWKPRTKTREIQRGSLFRYEYARLARDGNDALPAMRRLIAEVERTRPVSTQGVSKKWSNRIKKKKKNENPINTRPKYLLEYGRFSVLLPRGGSVCFLFTSR